MRSFYKEERGLALSATIDKYINVCIHRTPNRGIKIMYDEIEDLANIDLMNHGITKEVLKYYHVDKEITIASLSDIPSKGSGLGSSSAFTAGLMKGVAQGWGIPIRSPQDLAEKACMIEIEKCGYPIGKQDQYAAAYGGLNLFCFNQNDTVDVVKPTTNQTTITQLNDNLLLVYSGVSRSANDILKRQNESITNDRSKFNLVKSAVVRAEVAAGYLNKGLVDDFGNLFHEAWTEKKQITKGISQNIFDEIYTKCIQAGAIGGKLLGAGGGGFFLFYVKPDKRQNVINTINTFQGCKVYDFKFSWEGTQVLLS